jgi:hypothetical protein
MKSFPVPYAMIYQVDSEIENKMLKLGVIEESNSSSLFMISSSTIEIIAHRPLLSPLFNSYH